MKKLEQRFPPGWDEAKVLEVIAYYDRQTDEEAIAEMEAALEAERARRGLDDAEDLADSTSS